MRIADAGNTTSIIIGKTFPEEKKVYTENNLPLREELFSVISMNRDSSVLSPS